MPIPKLIKNVRNNEPNWSGNNAIVRISPRSRREWLLIDSWIHNFKAWEPTRWQEVVSGQAAAKVGPLEHIRKLQPVFGSMWKAWILGKTFKILETWATVEFLVEGLTESFELYQTSAQRKKRKLQCWSMYTKLFEKYKKPISRDNSKCPKFNWQNKTNTTKKNVKTRLRIWNKIGNFRDWTQTKSYARVSKPRFCASELSAIFYDAQGNIQNIRNAQSSQRLRWIWKMEFY